VAPDIERIARKKITPERVDNKSKRTMA